MLKHQKVATFVACIILSYSAEAIKPGFESWPVREISSPLFSVSSEEGEALRPGYHIIAPNGWMNDPVGMFEYRDVTHVFFQWSPHSVIWNRPHWGHAVSCDLVHWKYLPAALSPDQPYDEDGAFSGSAAFDRDGRPFLYYTGASREEELRYIYQQTAVALPLDYSDPDLKEWRKLSQNPLQMEVPVNGTHAQFRDPLTPLYKHGKFWTAVGGAVRCLGSAILYSSRDLISWDLAGTLADQLTAKTSSGHCSPAARKNPDGTWCKQFGTGCQAWECPDIFELGEHVTVLKYSDQIDGREPFAIDWYMLSDVGLQLPDSPTYSKDGVFKASLKGVDYHPRMIDYGAVYASKTWRASDGRRLWLGWVYETSPGCYQTCAMGSPFVDSMGMLTVIREITFDPGSSTLLFNPVKELSQLRGAILYNGTETLHKPKVIASSPSLVQSQLVANFKLPITEDSNSSAFRIGTMLRMSHGRTVSIFINGSITGSQVYEAEVHVDKSNSGKETSEAFEGGTIPLPLKGVRCSCLELNILFDHSLIEVFALGGRARIASRVYPEDISMKPAWEIELFGSVGLQGVVTGSATSWEMHASMKGP